MHIIKSYLISQLKCARNSNFNQCFSLGATEPFIPIMGRIIMDILMSEGDTNARAGKSTEWPQYTTLNCFHFMHHRKWIMEHYVFRINCSVCEIRWGGMNWIDLAQDRNHWRAVVNSAISLQVP
jgi:hypothetical protein